MRSKRFFNWWLRLAYRLLLRLRIDGLENVPAEGPVILMINHVHFLDPFVVVALMPRPITAMSKIENFSLPLMGIVFKLYGAIPVRRGKVDRRALRQALNVLSEEAMLLLAPEGTRSPNQALQVAHNGLAYIAHHANAAIVPTAITGTPEFGHHLKRLRRTPVHIKLGKPFQLCSDSRRLTRESLVAMTTEAMYQLAALLPPDYRGVYADLEQATEYHIQFFDGDGSNLPPSCQQQTGTPKPQTEGTEGGFPKAAKV
jgi:1-acyl-sn-glycerol-3-phosphate acyltransferase